MSLDDKSKSSISDLIFDLCYRNKFKISLGTVIEIQRKIIDRVESGEQLEVVFAEEIRSLHA